MTAVWRLLPFDRGPSARHFALSDALVRHSPGPSLWWHATDTPTLILGAGQRLEEIDLGRAERRGVQVIRRHTGGTAVLARPGVLGLDIVLPANEPPAGSDIVEAYQWLGETWRETLRALNVPAHVLSPSEAREGAPAGLHAAIVRLACFGSLSPYEVVAESRRKLVGLAQVRRGSRALFQAGIHTHLDAAGLADLLTGRDRDQVTDALRSAAVGLDELLSPPPSIDALMAGFEQAVERLWGVRVEAGDWTPEERAHAAGVEDALVVLHG